jgi:hypothetical protein
MRRGYKMPYTTEVNLRIYNDRDGDFVQVGPDADALDLVELRQYDAQEKILSRITMEPEQAQLLAKAINEYLSRSTEVAPEN